MADSPVYEPQVAPQVQPSAELPATARPETFGAGMGAAMENAAEIATRLHHDAYQQANQTAALDHNNAVEKWGQDNVYGINGVLGKPSGKNAPAVADQTLKGFDDFASKQMEGAANDDQRLAFQRINQAKRAELEKHLGAYEHAQVTQYQDQTDEAAISNAATSAAHNAYDADHVQDQIGKMQAVIADRGARKGVAPELVKVQQAEAASGTHLSVMEQMSLDGNNAAVAQYFQQHQGDLVGRDLLQARRMVGEGNRQDEGLAIARSVIAGAEPPVDPNNPNDLSGASREMALKALDARGITDARLYDEARRQIEAHYDSMAKAHSETQGSLLDRAFTEFDATGRVSPSVRAGMDHKSLAAVDALMRKKGQETDAAVYDTWQQRFSQAQDPDDLSRTDLLQDRGKMSDAVFRQLDKQLTETQTKLKDRNTTLLKGNVPFEVSRALFDENGLGLDGVKDPAQRNAIQKQRGDFMMQLQKWAGAEQFDLKRPLKPEEWEEGARKLFTTDKWQRVPETAMEKFRYSGQHGAFDWLTGGGQPGSNIPVEGPHYQLPYASKIAYDYSQIPAAEAAQAQKAALSAGIITRAKGDEDRPLTREERRAVVELYNQKLTKDYQKALDAYVESTK